MPSENVRLFVDIGNRQTSLKVLYGNGEQLTRRFASKLLLESVVYSTNEMLDLKNCSYINLHSGSQASDYGGRTIVVGGGVGTNVTPVYRFGVGGTGKINASTFFLAAGLEPRESVTDFIAEAVYLMHPDPTPQALEHFRSVLGGMHSYERNGTFCTVTIPKENIVLIPEGVSGFYHAVDQGLASHHDLNGYLDIGGLTTEFGLVNELGVVPGTRSSIDCGVVAFASKIAKAMKAEGLVSKDPDTSLILDGLLHAFALQGEDLRYFYGNRSSANGKSFDHLVPRNRKAWVMDLFGRFSELFGKIDAATYSSTVLMGGGALYIPASAIERFRESGLNIVVPDQPEMANVNGLSLLSDAEFLKKHEIPSRESNGFLLPVFALN